MRGCGLDGQTNTVKVVPSDGTVIPWIDTVTAPLGEGSGDDNDSSQ